VQTRRKPIRAAYLASLNLDQGLSEQYQVRYAVDPHQVATVVDSRQNCQCKTAFFNKPWATRRESATKCSAPSCDDLNLPIENIRQLAVFIPKNSSWHGHRWHFT
jgi:hypothetical protein